MTNTRFYRGASLLAAGVLCLAVLAAALFETALAAPEEADAAQPSAASQAFAGSSSCRECHESFYRLWAPSNHGLAMQPFTPAFARQNLTPHDTPIEVDGTRYRAVLEADGGSVLEQRAGEEKKYRIAHVLGGKNVFYFLTLLEGGRLQTLPLAYDVHDKRWYDMAGSAVRHFQDIEDEALDWRERPYTFNASCFGCHVSQLSTNYDFDSDSYNTEWAEPGINCETCHGSAVEHVRNFRAAKPGETPKELGLISTRDFSADQMNSLCAPCHAKMHPLSTDFKPGDLFFDHYDMRTLEDPDFYPDGRDLGENYTYTSWRMSPCVKAGELDCLHCHTSSGRYRFALEGANNACMPCHRQHVEAPEWHTHHEANTEGSQCISCHMPLSRFAAMNRSDHSMRPPMPAATLEFGSPNACNMCHEDQDAAWADKWVREWHERDYQAPALHEGALVAAARKQDWSKLPAMLKYIADNSHDEVTATSLIRMLGASPDDAKWPVLKNAMKDPSPLVRASAADALTGHWTPDTVSALIDRTKDKFRLVRIRAAGALAGIPKYALAEDQRERYEAALAELKQSYSTRRDDPYSHYNLGNLHMSLGDTMSAIGSFEDALHVQPENVMALVNASIAYNQAGQNDRAEASLRKALEFQPKSDAALLNLALLLGELGRMPEAEQAFRDTLEAEPKSAVAAYNLGVMLMGDRPAEALHWCSLAHTLDPNDPKRAYTYAFCLYKMEDPGKAAEVLQAMVDARSVYLDAYTLLQNIYAEQGDFEAAAAVHQQAQQVRAMARQGRAL